MSNHTILTIGAFLILTTVLVSLYRLLGTAGDDVSNAQDMILATTITTSYLELAQGLAFDQRTDTSNVAVANASTLTPVVKLGADTAAENSPATFNDFDDFNGFTIEKAATGSNKRFTSTFRVSYVQQSNVDAISAVPTFVKRLDVRTWRSYPLMSEGQVPDTLRMSICMGYWHYD
jgi:hypothetical protein